MEQENNNEPIDQKEPTETPQAAESKKDDAVSEQPVQEETKSEPTEKTAQPSSTEDAPASAPQGGQEQKQEESRGGPRRDQRRGGPRGGPRRGPVKRDDGDSEFVEKVLSIKRVTKVTKGGKKLSFSALVVVGDTKGNVGYSLEKAGEVAGAIRKAMNTAKKRMVRIPMKGTTIPHEIIGVCGGAEVLLKPASDGTGVIASGPVRAVCDGAGIHNILTKCHRSNNPINVVKATMDGLMRLKTAKTVDVKDPKATEKQPEEAQEESPKESEKQENASS